MLAGEGDDDGVTPRGDKRETTVRDNVSTFGSTRQLQDDILTFLRRHWGI